jgi:hypothetical protein
MKKDVKVYNLGKKKNKNDPGHKDYIKPKKGEVK